MNYTKKFLMYFLTGAIVLSIFHMYLSAFLVFGRSEIGFVQAILTTAFGLALSIMVVDLVVLDYKIKIPTERYIFVELMANIAMLYLLARTPLQNSVGVGISAFWVAIAVGFVLSIVQFGVKKITDQK